MRRWMIILVLFYSAGCSSPVTHASLPTAYELLEQTTKIAFPFVLGDTTVPVEGYVIDTLYTQPVPNQAERKRLYGKAHFNMLPWIISPDGNTVVLSYQSRNENNEIHVHEIVLMKLDPPDWTIMQWHVSH